VAEHKQRAASIAEDHDGEGPMQADACEAIPVVIAPGISYVYLRVFCRATFAQPRAAGAALSRPPSRTSLPSSPRASTGPS